MKTAVVALTTKQELQKAAAMLVSASAQYVGAQPVFCMLDCGVPAQHPQGYLFFSGEELLGSQYRNLAFSLLREEYYALCMVRLVQGLLREYDSVVVLRPGQDVENAPKFGYARNTLMVVPRTQDSVAHPLSLDASLQTTPLYENCFAVFCRGEKLSRWLSWCAAKMTYLVQSGAPCTDAQGRVTQRAFFGTWLGYASLFGCTVVLLESGWLRSLPEGVGAFDTFRDGTRVPPVLRVQYGADYRLQARCGNDPFRKMDQFTAVSCLPGDTHPVPFVPAAMAVYHAAELENVYPDINGEGRIPFLQWFVQHYAEYDMHPVFAEHTRQALAEYEAEQQRRREQREQREAEARSMSHRLRGLLAKQETAPLDTAVEEPETALPFGVNLVGPLLADSSAGESARSLLRVLQASGVPFAVTETRILRREAYTDTEYSEQITNEMPYAVNLFAMEPDDLAATLPQLAQSALQGRYCIAYWAWPLAQLPAGWQDAAAWLDEIWTPSRFAAEAVRQSVAKPVFAVPYTVVPQKETSLTRQDFGLPDGRFLVLAMADLCMGAPLHNLQAAVDAFTEAFAGNDRVHLVIKLNTPPGWSGDDGLDAKAHETDNIHILTDVLTKSVVNSLMSLCDAYISLHHATAFGFAAAQAMAMGKPVILTGYGGCTQYMRPDACVPVAFSLTDIPAQVGAPAGCKWALPSCHAAAEAMQKLVRDTTLRAKMGVAGKHIIEQEFSPEAVGAAVKSHLAALDVQKNTMR